MGDFRGGDCQSHLLQESFLVSTQRPLEHQPVRGMIAAKNRALEFQTGQEALHLDKQFTLIQWLPGRKPGAKTFLALRKADDQRRQVFRLCHIGQPRRIFRVLLAQSLAA